MIKKPMLAASMEDSKGNPVTFEDLKYPLFASIKLDGIRALKVNGQVLSRSFKPIPNTHIQAMMTSLPDGLDGELVVVGEEFAGTSSAVMSRDGTPNFQFQIFDYVKDDLNKPFSQRLVDLEQLKSSGILPDFCVIVKQVIVNSANELSKFEEIAISEGHEGVMIRKPDSPYKCGRSSFREGYLIKIKRFIDSEAEIIGFEERMKNENEATIDELGYTKRSSAKDGLVPANTLGTLIVRDIHDGREFGIGTGKGLDDVLRKTIWDNKDKYLGKIIKYRFQEVGVKDLPRIPSFQGFRDEIDM